MKKLGEKAIKLEDPCLGFPPTPQETKAKVIKIINIQIPSLTKLLKTAKKIIISVL